MNSTSKPTATAAINPASSPSPRRRRPPPPVSPSQRPSSLVPSAHQKLVETVHEESEGEAFEADTSSPPSTVGRNIVVAGVPEEQRRRFKDLKSLALAGERGSGSVSGSTTSTSNLPSSSSSSSSAHPSTTSPSRRRGEETSTLTRKTPSRQVGNSKLALTPSTTLSPTPTTPNRSSAAVVRGRRGSSSRSPNSSAKTYGSLDGLDDEDRVDSNIIPGANSTLPETPQPASRGGDPSSNTTAAGASPFLSRYRQGEAFGGYDYGAFDSEEEQEQKEEGFEYGGSRSSSPIHPQRTGGREALRTPSRRRPEQEGEKEEEEYYDDPNAVQRPSSTSPTRPVSSASFTRNTHFDSSSTSYDRNLYSSPPPPPSHQRSRSHSPTKSLSAIPGVAALAGLISGSREGSPIRRTVVAGGGSRSTTPTPGQQQSPAAALAKRFTVIGLAGENTSSTANMQSDATSVRSLQIHHDSGGGGGGGAGSVKSRPASLFGFFMGGTPKTIPEGETPPLTPTPMSTRTRTNRADSVASQRTMDSNAGTTPFYTPQRASISGGTPGGAFSSTFHTPRRTQPGSGQSMRSVDPPVPELVDEFEGLSFGNIIKSFLQPPSTAGGTPSDPAQALLFTAEGRLEALAEEATSLLERVHRAYLKRTAALEDALREQEALAEELEGEKVQRRVVMGEVERERGKREERERRVTELEGAVRGLVEEGKGLREQNEMLKMQLRENPSQGGRGQEKSQMSEDTGTPETAAKRISSAHSSDSGFDSDPENPHNLQNPSSSTTTTQQLDTTHVCPYCHRPTATALPPSTPSTQQKYPRSPSPLREIWSHQDPTTAPKHSTRETAYHPPTTSSRPTTPTPISTTQIQTIPETPSTPVVAPTATPTTTSRSWFPMLRKGITGGGGGAGDDGANVDKLRQENRVLRERVGQLEMAVDGCLGVIGGWRGD